VSENFHQRTVRRAHKRLRKNLYLRDRREKHAEENKQYLRTKYKEDPAHRQRIKNNMKAYHDKRRVLVKRVHKALGGVKPRDSTEELLFCPVCGTHIREIKPDMLLVDGFRRGIKKRFLVQMVPKTVVTVKLCISLRTLEKWLREGLIPRSQYRNSRKQNLWTQDQLEALMVICNRYTPRSGVLSFRSMGLVDMVKESFAALAPLGIDQSLYTESSDQELFQRPDLILPPPTQKRKEYLAHVRNQKNSRQGAGA
jgi:hypothetical protein